MQDGDGQGKTIVMAMLVAWQMLNKVAFRRTTDTQNTSHGRAGANGEKPLQVLDAGQPGELLR